MLDGVLHLIFRAMEHTISLSTFEFLSLISAIVSFLTIPLIIYIWKSAMKRLDKVEKDVEKTVTDTDHKEDIRRMERAVERIEKDLSHGFDTMNKRIDDIFKLLTRGEKHESN